MIYLGKGGQVPYLSKIAIVRTTEEVLNEYWDGNLPVNIEQICDGIGINILPIPSLSKNFYIDAFISADFKTIFVDEDEYTKESHRYRFSVAHELGHLVLHKKYYPREIKNLNEWVSISKSVTNDYAEFQANYFAGNLLVPDVELAKQLNDAFDGSFARNYWDASSSELGKILNSIRQKFKVSDIVIARRIRDVFPGIGM